MQSQKNFYPVTHRYIGQGDYKTYEATFELIKAWDSSLESNWYHYFSPSTNSEFYKVKDVFRKWALNEAGDYTDSPYNRGDSFDFISIFQTSDYAACRRRFWPCLTTDSQNKSLGYFLQVSYDDGLTWNQYSNAFNLLVDECGIWLSSDQLGMELVSASFNDKLRFRITASVISDERLSVVVSEGPVNSVVPVVDEVITLPRQYKYRKVSSKSIFSAINNDGFGVSDEVDDTDSLFSFVRQIAADSSQAIETINLQTPILGFDYQLGDIVNSNPESRDIFSKYDNRSIS